MYSVEKNDLINLLVCEDIEWTQFNNKKILITGGTGLIGSMMTKLLLLRNELYNSNIVIFCLVRDVDRARNQTKEYKDFKNVQYIEGSVESVNLSSLCVDYIVHTAAPTKSSFFIEKPVETIETIVLGTKNILDYSIKAKVKSVVNVSSMESYGTINDIDVTEEKLGEIPLNSLRSSYPESKRLSELMSFSYSKEYNVNVTSLRLAQTFGAGITKNENRVFKYFCDCIINNDDIILKSTGETIINFCYLSDAIKAILILLTRGKSGEIYNASGESFSMTIKDLAQWLLDYHMSSKKLIIDAKNNDMYAPINKMIMNSDKLKALGWVPEVDIKIAYLRLIEFLMNG